MTMAYSYLIEKKSFIDNKLVEAKNGKTFNVFNPSNNELIGSAPDMEVEDTELAVNAAYSALLKWKRTTAKHRSELLRKLYELMTQHQEELAKIITLENGKPLAEAKGEIAYAASFCEWFAEEGRRIQGSILSSPFPDRSYMVLKQPIGVCGMITPWNFPVGMLTRKACAAIAAGCTVVLKPSEDTPLSALGFCKLFQEAGFPPGVFNVVTCDRSNAESVGKTLCDSKLVSLISFTGSSATGKLVLGQCSNTVKKCVMELGGNAPFIVFDSADLNDAVTGAMACKFRCTGQTCVCANRFLIHESLYDAFCLKMADTMSKSLHVGDGMMEGVNQGPLINERGIQKVNRIVQDAINKGAKVLLGGMNNGLCGNFFEPTLLKDVTTDMQCVKEEIFGPVVAVMKFETEEEAITLANSTTAGLGGYVYTRDVKQMFRVSEAIDFGIIGLNEGLFHCAEAPMGGYKESGLGREGGIGFGIEEFLENKLVCIGNN